MKYIFALTCISTIIAAMHTEHDQQKATALLHTYNHLFEYASHHTTFTCPTDQPIGITIYKELYDATVTYQEKNSLTIHQKEIDLTNNTIVDEHPAPEDTYDQATYQICYTRDKSKKLETGKSYCWRGQIGDGRKYLHPLEHDGRVHSIAINNNETLALTASTDATAKIWNLANGELITTLKGHTDCVRKAVFNHNGNLIVTASDDTTAIIWNTILGKKIHTLIGHTHSLYDASFDKTSNRVVTASSDKTANVWHVATGKKLYTLHHQEPVTQVHWHNIHSKIISACQDGTIHIWHVHNLATQNEDAGCILTLKDIATIILPNLYSLCFNRPYLEQQKIKDLQKLINKTTKKRDSTSICSSSPLH